MSPHDRYLRLDGVRAELRTRSVRSGFIALTARGSQILLQLGSLVVLARLLTPEDFGVIAFVLPFAVLMNSISHNGLQSAVIHRETLEQDEVSALFWYAARMNLLASAGFAALGPLLAYFYDDPRVIPVAAAWAGVVYIASVSSVHEALLKRQLRFGTVMSLHIGALAVGTALALLLAFAGAGHWALFAQTAVMEVGRSGAVWLACGWRPSVTAFRDRASSGSRALRSYWGNLAGYRVLSWLGDNPDRILVGALGGAGVIGLYDSARRWAWYPFAELFISLGDVAVASFSRVRADAPRYREMVRRALTPVLAACMPAIAFIFVEARATLLVLMGDQWVDAVPFLRLMCVAAFAGSISRVTMWLYLSTGETRRQLRFALWVQTPVTLAAVLLGVRWGAIGVSWGFMAANVLLVLPNVAYCIAATPLTMFDYARTVWRPFTASLAAAAALALAATWLPDSGARLVPYLLRLAAFLFVFGAAWWALPGGRRATLELVEILAELRRRRAAAALGA